ncbi:MAG: FAD binding domain-containing protein [Pseudomonadota bacterium]
MKPAAFGYTRPASLDAAAEAIAGGAAKPASGTQSLGPMLNLRLARPGHLVDLSALPELTSIVVEPDGRLRIGAGVTHGRIEDGALPENGPRSEMLRHVAGDIAYRAVRNRGTLGGSLAHADPAADWVTTMTALDATLELIAWRSGRLARRQIAMRRFMLGAYRTALESDEILSAVLLPKLSDSACWGYAKICRKVGEFADAMAAVVLDPASGYARGVVGSTGGAPVLFPHLAADLARQGQVPEEAVVGEALDAALPGLALVKRKLMTVALVRAMSQTVVRQ